MVVPAARVSPAPRLPRGRTTPTGNVSRSAATLVHVQQAYPLLRDAAISCDDDGCALTGLILPPTDQAYLDQRQEMLLGGLAAILATHGYQTSAPVHLDEVESNTFRLRVHILQRSD